MTESSDPPRAFGILGVAAAYGVVHAIVDGICAAILFHQTLHSTLSTDALWTLFVVYNAVAFGLQFSLGAVADRFGAYRGAIFLGLGLLAVAVIGFRDMPMVAGLLAGLGNAAFHVGAGAIVLRRSVSRTSAAGIFVGPGAVGLTLGGLCGRTMPGWHWPALGLLAVSTLALWAMGDRAADRSVLNRGQQDRTPVPIRSFLALLAATALLLCVAIRAIIGLTVGIVHQGHTHFLIALALGACVGAVVGGLVADRIGWIKTAVAGLLLSAPLLAFCPANSLPLILGVVLFQMTMPVTLLAIYRVFPHEPGLAFGLPSLALLIGGTLVFVLPSQSAGSGAAMLWLSAIALTALLAGLLPIARASGQEQRR